MAISALLLIALFVSCGGGGQSVVNPPPPPPPAPDFKTADFNGAYLFSFGGSEGSGETYWTAKLVADGAGTLTGTLWFNHAELHNGLVVVTGVTGTYVVADDGRTTVSITTPTPSFQGTTGPFSFQTTLRKNAGSFELIPMQTGFSGSGLITKLPDTPPASLSGNFAFRYEGATDVLGPQYGAGVMHLGTDGLVTGTLDSNLRGFPAPAVPFVGTFTMNSDGSGTMALSYTPPSAYFAPPKNLSFQAVSNDQLILVGADSGTAAIGEAKRQSGRPFSNTSLSGPFALQGNGMAYDPNTTYFAGTTAMVGQTTFDGAGNSSGSMDLANPGGVIPNLAVSGPINIGSTGRAEAAVANGGSTTSIVFYLISSTEAYFITMDPGSLAYGRMKAQNLSNLSASSFNGEYTMFMAAPMFDATAISGRMKADGSGGLSGVVDGMSQGMIATEVSMTGTYSFDATGHASITITGSGGSSTFTGYALSENELYILTTDPYPMVSGCAHKQM